MHMYAGEETLRMDGIYCPLNIMKCLLIDYGKIHFTRRNSKLAILSLNSSRIHEINLY